MTKAKISEYDAVAANNTDVNGVNIAENCPPSGMNNMGREIMAALKRFQTGSDGDGVTVGGNLVVSGSSTLSTTSISSADINAGTIDGTVIGGSTAAAGSFTTLNTSGAVVFNDAGADVDFRVEGDTNANLIVADAGVDKVGIGTNTFNTNGGVLQVSNGISFPATQSASTDANTLDDYEEGTFSPSFSGSGGSAGAAAIAAVSGRYTKTGRIVTVNLEFYISNKGSWTGDFRITNLPFTLGNASATAMAIAYAACTNVDASMIVARVNNNSNYIIIGTGANFNTPLQLTSVGLNEYWILSGTYEVA
jgi:hypothetical protein